MALAPAPFVSSSLTKIQCVDSREFTPESRVAVDKHGLDGASNRLSTCQLRISARRTRWADADQLLGKHESIVQTFLAFAPSANLHLPSSGCCPSSCVATFAESCGAHEAW